MAETGTCEASVDESPAPEQPGLDGVTALVAELSKKYFPGAAVPKVRIEPWLVERGSHGWADSHGDAVVVSPRLLGRPRELRRVLLHELSHLGADRTGVRPAENAWIDKAHGPIFRSVLRALVPFEGKWIEDHLAPYERRERALERALSKVRDRSLLDWIDYDVMSTRDMAEGADKRSARRWLLDHVEDLSKEYKVPAPDVRATLGFVRAYLDA